LGAWCGGAVQVRLGCGIGDDARTKFHREQVRTPFPSGCSHRKKGRGTIRAGVVAVACTWDVAPGLGLRGGVEVKALSSIASGISGSGSRLFV